MSETDIILQRMGKIAESEGYELTENAPSIARAKMRRYGLFEWFLCPCGTDLMRHCISDKCKLEIAQNGQCHCRAYRLKKEFIDKIKDAKNGTE